MSASEQVSDKKSADSDLLAKDMAQSQSPMEHQSQLQSRPARQYDQQQAAQSDKQQPLPPEEQHILVCLSSAPSNARIIRTAARMAAAFKGTFTALFVETPDFAVMSEENKKRLQNNIQLAQQLGARIETVYGDDISFQIAEFARLSGVSQIVIGRSAATRRWLWGKPALTEKLIAGMPDIDIHIIPDSTQSTVYYAQKAAGITASAMLRDTSLSLLVLFLCTLIGLVFSELGFTEANIITVYILGVLLIAVITGHRVYSLAAAIVSVLVFNFFFTVPRFSLQAYDSGYPVTFVVMFVSAFIVGTLAVRLKEQVKQSARVAYRTRVLLETNQLLQQAGCQQEILAAAARQIVKLLSRDVVAYPAAAAAAGLGQPQFFAAAEGAPAAGCCSAQEKAAADWVFKNNKHAGATTAVFAEAQCLYLAIRVNSHVYGVVGIVIDNRPLEALENSVLLSILGECALALENEKNNREKEEAAVLARNEQLRADLLRAISHDLRTPLTSISGNASNLLFNENGFDEESKKQAYTDIYEDAIWLINLVENLLAVTRLEEGRLHLQLTPELVDEVVAEALRHVNRQSAEHHISVSCAEDFMLAQMDPRLIVQVVINIVDNAIKYTPPGSDISIAIAKSQGKIFVRIADNGPGIPDNVKPHVFDMFYTGANKIADSRRSLGLGLSLCRSVLQAHGGEIFVTDNQPQGSVFTFTLPAEEVTLHE